MKITIFGDICPTKDTQAAFDRGDRESIFGDTFREIESSDIVIGNLECAVTDQPKPIQKAGPVLYTGVQSIQTLKDFDILSIANNHIRDCGDEGVMTALETCKKLGIRTLGAGKSMQEARKPLVIEKCGIKIGLMSFAEQEFNIASDIRPGACYLDLYDDFDRIREFRKTVDYLIILYHGGIEYFPYASPELSRKCRKMVDCGADLISCQHSHCIGTIEQYNGSTIVYGQGNSVFGYRDGDNSWNRGLLLQVEFQKAGSSFSSLFTYKGMVATSKGLRWMSEDASENLSNELKAREQLSQNRVAVQKEWDKFCDSLGKIHLPLLLGWPKILIAINRRTDNSLIKMFYGRLAYNNTHNLIRCEAHREVIDNLLSKKDFS
ncbi:MULTISPECIES: CapA family protein [Bacteroides]|uniref:CapA family protein n=3 Tax=Bacteroidales TaxID=171549 RepID=A0A4S2ALU8_9BACE|nr:CapA family protein [Bacteroides acidifaciens]TGY01905.1 CapA family protein [Bacteroides acidifaciens]